MNWLIVILVLAIVIGSFVLLLRQTSCLQKGGEYVHYTHLPPENSQRVAPLGYRSDDGYTSPSVISPQCHAMPTRRHPRNVVHSDGRDDRQPNCDCYQYDDQFDYKPYDWRPFEWRPFWRRRAYLEPSAKNCSEYATDQCIGTGTSDYQSCYDQQEFKCPFPKDLKIVPSGGL